MDLAGSEAAPIGDVIVDGLGRVGGRGESGQVEGSTQKEGDGGGGRGESGKVGVELEKSMGDKT